MPVSRAVSPSTRSPKGGRSRLVTRSRAVRILTGVTVWMLAAVGSWVLLFTHHHRDMVLGGHQVVVTPTFDPYAVLRMGPYIPDVRIPTGGRIGVSILVEKTTADSTSTLVERYALMAARPDPEIRRVTDQIADMAITDAMRAAAIGLLPIGLWVLIGPERRRQLMHPTRHVAATAGIAIVGIGVLAWQPWLPKPEQSQAAQWIPLSQAVPGVSVPTELRSVQVEGGLLTNETEFLVRSALRVFAESKTYYSDLTARVATVADRIRQPVEGDTVALLISDRHDNIGMDLVARAIALAGKATVVIDAGDDTSSGQSWESFSLESLDDVFHDFPVRLFVAGNHDNGGFVASYLEKAGWTHLDEKVSTPFGGVRMIGIDDPRANALVDPANTDPGNFAKVTQQLSDRVCADAEAGDRIDTVVVHSATMAMPALDRGCTDLILAGHLHVQVGPDRIVGTNGAVGYRYTNGTTGGATYSFAMGSSLQKTAEVTLVTWRKGHPVGIQPVSIDTKGQITVKPYVPLDYRPAS